MNSPTLHPSRPLVAASLNSDADLRNTNLHDLPTQCDILEIRLDGLGSTRLNQLNKCPVPLLWTARSHQEGGIRPSWDWPQRLLSLQTHVTQGSMVDIECATLANLDHAQAAHLQNWLNKKSLQLIASLHDFNNIPDKITVEQARQTARYWNAACLKIAAHTESLADVLSLATFLVDSPIHPPMALMGMGKMGRSSRLLFAEAGSVLNYGFLHNAAVPGQWPAAELKRLLNHGSSAAPQAMP